MIESILVGIPNFIMPRVQSPELEKFERVTGIKKTRRYNGNSFSMITDTLKHRKSPLEVPDNLIVVTQSPDQFSPCMAADVHDYLRFPSKTIAFDVNHACDGWVLGVHLANRLGGRTMLICVDRLRFEPNEIEKYIFSDACTITMIQAGIEKFKSFTDGSKSDLLFCGLDGEMVMDGGAVFDFVSTKVPDFIDSFDIGYDWLAPHQANISMLKLLERRTDYENRVLYSIEEYGNQSMSSIPTCLAHNEDKILDKSVLCVGFGAGFTAAGIALHWSRAPVTRIVEI